MQQHNRTPTPTNTHNWQHILLNRQNPQHNTQTSNIPHNITQNVQSQIHYFLLNQTYKITQCMTRNNTPCTHTNTNKYNKNTMLKFMKTPRNTNHNRHLSKNKLHKKMHNNLQYKAVTNLSDKNISNSTLIALSKGLSYIPSPKPAPYKQIYNSFLKYRKNMYNRYFFRHNTNTNRHPFKLPTNFTAPIPDNSNLQEYISNIYHDLKTEYEKHKEHAKPNISKDELQAVHNLKTDNDLIVKPADKGGAIVIWPRDAYLAEAYRQLNDSNHYQKLTYDPTLETLAETKRLANKLHTSDIIDNTTHKFLTIDNQARTPQLYLLAKIHKQDNPGRPIISGCGGVSHSRFEVLLYLDFPKDVGHTCFCTLYLIYYRCVNTRHKVTKTKKSTILNKNMFTINYLIKCKIILNDYK